MTDPLTLLTDLEAVYASRLDDEPIYPVFDFEEVGE
jgi:hypothetical protein